MRTPLSASLDLAYLFLVHKFVQFPPHVHTRLTVLHLFVEDQQNCHALQFFQNWRTNSCIFHHDILLLIFLLQYLNWLGIAELCAFGDLDGFALRPFDAVVYLLLTE